MPVWSTECLDWADRIRTGRSIIPPPIFAGEAESALAIFKALQIADVPGSPTMGEACKPWIFDFVASVFGSYDPGDTPLSSDETVGRRLINEWMLSVSKKNFKSGLAAGIMLTALIRNWRDSAEYGILAPTIEIAANSFGPARDMVRKDEELSDLFLVQDHIRTITDRRNGATLKVIAAENETVGGKKFTGVLFDELWLFGKRPNASDMWREATGGLVSRPEGFVISLTTMSNEAPAGVFLQKLKYGRGVRDGRIKDKKFVSVLYEFPDDMINSKSYREPENWWMTNPNFGASVDSERLNGLLMQAQESGEEELIGFFAKHLNVEIGLNLRSDRWAGADFWERQAVKSFTLADLIARCEVATVGIDGGGLDDLLGLTVIGREKVTGKWLWWAHAWAHEIVLERRKEIAPRLLDFQKDGDLTIVDKPGPDVEGVADIVCRLAKANLLPPVHAIGVDAAGIGAIVNELTTKSRGIKMEQIIAIRQGYTLNGAIKDTERMLAGGEIVHTGSALMAWCVSNARIEDKGNAIIITKQVSGKSKIDPLMAGFNAVMLMNLNPAAPGGKFQFFSIG